MNNFYFIVLSDYLFKEGDIVVVTNVLIMPNEVTLKSLEQKGYFPLSRKIKRRYDSEKRKKIVVFIKKTLYLHL